MGDENNLDASAGELYVNKSISGFDADGDDAALTHVGELLEAGFLDCALLGGEENKIRLLPRFVLLVRAGFGDDADLGGDFFVGLEFE